MNNEKCRIQIMEEFLTNNQSWEVEDENFLEVRKAYNNCLTLLWIEEKFNIVRDNFYEWEQEIKNSYDFLIQNQSGQSDCNNIMNEHGTKEIIVFNRRLFNVLNSIRMYRDQVLHDLSKLGGGYKEKFEKETNNQYDKTFSYQIMELLRNYMQHQGLVIERITAMIPFSRKLGKELWYFVESNYTTMQKIDKFKNKIKCEPTANGKIEWINLIGIMREYYTQIIDLHKYFRTITEESYSKDIICIGENITRVYKNLPVKIIAFYGKKNCEEYQDFLLQISYIDKLKAYREKDYKIDTTRYYIAKRCLLESEKIKVTNSATHKFRYNK